MPGPTSQTRPVVLVWGDDELTVQARAREIFQSWHKQPDGGDEEIINASASNSGEALKALNRLREAMQTLPFFGSAKAIWFQGCNFLSDERTAGAQAVTDSLAELAQELKAFDWKNVRLLISAGKVDKRKVFFKALEKISALEQLAGLSIDDRDWSAQAEAVALRRLRTIGKRISDEALSELVANVGPNLPQLESEVGKLELYVGDRVEIRMEDVAAIVTRNKHARSFALADALGDRDLPRLLKCLDEELWSIKTDPKKSIIGLLYGLIAKVRVLLLLKELLNSGVLKPERDFNRFRSHLERVPAGALPDDKRFNPLSMNPYVVFKALSQTPNYSSGELVRALELLFRCNQQLFSRTDERVVLQRALIEIIGTGNTVSATGPESKRSVATV